MITTHSAATDFQTKFGNGQATAIADAGPDKGGQGRGFLPHDLLEAALATCANITARVYAHEHGIPLQEVEVGVTLDRADHAHPIMRGVFRGSGHLTDDQRAAVLEAVRHCPVSKTLSGFHIAWEVDEAP